MNKQIERVDVDINYLRSMVLRLELAVARSAPPPLRSLSDTRRVENGMAMSDVYTHTHTHIHTYNALHTQTHIQIHPPHTLTQADTSIHPHTRTHTHPRTPKPRKEIRGKLASRLQKNYDARETSRIIKVST